MNCRTEFTLNQIINACPPAQALAHLNYSPLTDLQFRIRICFYQKYQWRCINSGENEKQDNRAFGHNCYTNINSTFFRVFSPNIFNPSKLLNTILDDVTISNKLTSLTTYPVGKGSADQLFPINCYLSIVVLVLWVFKLGIRIDAKVKRLSLRLNSVAIRNILPTFSKQFKQG